MKEIFERLALQLMWLLELNKCPLVIPSGKNAKKNFKGSHYDTLRLIVLWMLNSSQDLRIIPKETKVFDFWKDLEPYLQVLIQKRITLLQEQGHPKDFAFPYREDLFPLSGQIIIGQEALQQEMQRRHTKSIREEAKKNRELHLVPLTGILPNDEPPMYGDLKGIAA